MKSMNMEKLKDEVERLVKIMEVLRGPNGCPWDKQQDYYSLQPYVLEEAYEVVEALQKKDLDLLKEELGDLLLQVVFQAQIAREKGDFNLIDIFKAISDKLVRRHPHVFQDREVNTISELKATWEEIKGEERIKKGKVGHKSILEDLSQAQPALNQAYEVQAKAAEVGFDWDNVEDVIAKIEEEIHEVREAIRENQQEEIGKELGDLLFAVVNLSRFFAINPELALLQTILKFKERFKYIEFRAREEGYNFAELSLKELDSYWEESKTKLEGEQG